jgi:osmotically-inducible protein OsmY
MKKLLPVLTLAVVALLVLPGCAILQGQDLDDMSGSDDGIASIATSRLNSDSMTARSTLSVTVANGRATLYGTVPDEVVRQRAIQILEGTPGIYEVLDRTRKR